MKVGDLVCLYRRKQQGVGIILNKKSLQESELKLIKEAQRADWKQKEVLKHMRENLPRWSKRRMSS